MINLAELGRVFIVCGKTNMLRGILRVRLSFLWHFKCRDGLLLRNMLFFHTLKGKVVAFWVRKVASLGTAHINDFTNSDALVKQLLAGLLHVIAAKEQ